MKIMLMGVSFLMSTLLATLGTVLSGRTVFKGRKPKQVYAEASPFYSVFLTPRKVSLRLQPKCFESTKQ